MKHNKRRNSMIIYELLTKAIATALIEGDQKRSNDMLNILKEHYKEGTAIHNEFRTMNFLLNTKAKSETIAFNIINEVKQDIKNKTAVDLDQLEKEKTHLLKAIAECVKDEYFYDQPIDKYRTIASIQTLINEWRKPASNLNVIEIESNLIDYLKQDKNTIVKQESPMQEGNHRLLTKLMANKLNERYEHFSTLEKSIIKDYMFNNIELKNKLQEIRQKTLISLENFAKNELEQEQVTNKHITGKINEVKDFINSYNFTDAIDDDIIVKHLKLIKIIDACE